MSPIGIASSRKASKHAFDPRLGIDYHPQKVKASEYLRCAQRRLD